MPGEDLANDPSVVVDIVCNDKHNYAYFGVQASFDSKLGEKKPRDCQILSFSKPLTKVYESMAFKKGSPYTGLINH